MLKITITAVILTMCTLISAQDLSIEEILILQHPDWSALEVGVSDQTYRNTQQVHRFLFLGTRPDSALDRKGVRSVLDTLQEGNYYLVDVVDRELDIWDQLSAENGDFNQKLQDVIASIKQEGVSRGTSLPKATENSAAGLGGMAVELLDKVIEEEAIDLAVHYLEKELHRFKSVDTLFDDLFPSVSGLLENYNSNQASSLFLHHLHRGLRSDLESFGFNVLTALHDVGEINRAQYDLSVVIQNRLQYFDRPASWLNISYHGNSADVWEHAFMVNKAAGFTEGVLPSSGALDWLEEKEIADAFMRWKSLEGDGVDRPEYVSNYFEGWAHLESFLLGVYQTGQPEISRNDFVRALISWGKGGLTPSEALEVASLLELIADFEVNFKLKGDNAATVLVDMAALLGMDDHPVLLMLLHLAVQAEPESFNRTLTSLYIPHTNYQALRKKRGTLLLMAYLGAAVGYESILSAENNPGAGLHLSTGLLAGPGFILGNKGWSHGFFLQVIDVGAPFSLLVNDLGAEGKGSFNEQIQLESMVSPGLGYFLGIKNIPASIGLSMSFQADGRQLGEAYENTHRINLGLYMDFPVFTIKQFHR